MAIFKDYEINSGLTNMAIDSQLLEYSIENNLKEPILRFYGWSPPCISLGRNQSDKFINKEFCSKNNIDIVKRLTGGRALLHDNELTYSFICPVKYLNSSDSVILSYKEISSALITGFRKLKIELAFAENKKPNAKFDYCMFISSGADLSYEGKKLIGSAQFRKNNYLLQHGSILINYNKQLIKDIFHDDYNEDCITFLEEIDKNISIEMLKQALKEGFVDYFNLNLS